MISKRLPLALGLGLAVLYAVRAVTGVIGGVAYAQGSLLADAGDFYGAGHKLEWGVGGDDPAGLLWLRGQVAHGRWELMLQEGDGVTRRSNNELIETHNAYAQAIAESPSSGWYWCDLAETYKELELQDRAERPVDLDSLDRGPWGLVGRAGRIAIGLCRRGVAREPNFHVLHDQLATIYFEAGLDQLGLEQVRAAARVQPIYYLHPFSSMIDPPPHLLDAFAEASREALGRTPLLRKTVHRTALGRIEIQRGNYEQAVTDLEAALALPGEELNRAEAEYYLGYALMQLERYDEAEQHLLAAEEHPRTEASALYARALIAERRGDLDGALDLLVRLRRLEPRNLSFVMYYARIARQLQRWDQCEDALRWARIVAPGESGPLVELVEVYLEQHDTTSAYPVLEDLERQEGDSAVVQRLQKEIRDVATRRGTAAGR